MMDDKVLEDISATIDNELEPEEMDRLFSQIETDQQAKASWQRYHLIGDAMRDSLPDTINPKLAEQVSQRLNDEPISIMPKNKPVRRSNFYKPLAGLAIAASLTMVAILVSEYKDPDLPHLSDTKANESLVIQQPVKPKEERVFGTAVKSKIPTVKVRKVKYKPMKNPVQRKRLNSYILNHNQFNSRNGMPGSTANARLVRHKNE